MEWKIPLSDIDLGQDEIDAVTDVLNSKWLTMGEVTRNFEIAFANYTGAKYAYAVANCTAALHIACQALGITGGDEVICPSLTFVATANSIIYTGATPVFADVTNLDDLNISPDDIVKKITNKTKAITVVHYGGYPCDMNNILQIAKEHGLNVIEDAAHAPGAEYKGKKIGTVGEIGCFSFFSNKNMTTGEGGMITTNNADLAERIKGIRSHGMTTLTWDRHKGHAYSYDVKELGFNYRLDEMRAAIGIVQLQKLTKNNNLRERIVKAYIKELSGIDGINIPFQKYRDTSSYHIFPILLDTGIDRNQFRDALKNKGVQTSMHYPPVHLFSFYKQKYGYRGGELPITENIFDREVTLPLYPGMTADHVQYIAESIKCILDSIG